MKHTFHLLFTILSIFVAEHSFSQDINPFYSDENKFSAALQLSGAFPVGGFSHADISFPCNSAVSTGSAFELSLGCKINPNYGVMVLLSEGFYELDPSGAGAFQLVSNYPGLYESASVLKNGQFISQSALAGGFYDLPLSKKGNIFFKPHIMIGILGCNVPNIEIVGNHNPGAADKKGNSIDTVETWDTPKIYAYSYSYRLGAAVYYSFNKSFGVFFNVDYQGGSLTYTNTPVTYNITVNSINSTSGVSTPLQNSTRLSEVSPTVSYQVISMGLGFEVRF